MLWWTLRKLRNPEKRNQTVEKLVHSGERGVRPLMMLLREKDSELRATAGTALVRVGSSAVEPLITALDEAEHAIREEAAKALGQIKDVRAAKPLIVALGDSDPAVRFEAGAALGNLKDHRSIQPLIATAQDGGNSFYEGALVWAVRELRKEDAIESLVACLTHCCSSVRCAAKESLLEIKDARSIPLLIDLLKNSELQVRNAVVELLAVFKDQSVIEPLIACVKDASPSVGANAVKALMAFTDSRIVPALLEALKEESLKDSWVRQDIVRVLGVMKDSRSIEPLIALFANVNEDYQVRQAVCWVLEGFNDLRATRPFVEALSESSGRMVYCAASALTKMKDPQSFELLLETARHHDQHVRHKALEILGEIKDPRAVEALLAAAGEGEFDRKGVIWAITHLKTQRNIEVLIAALKSRTTIVRAQAASALIDLQDDRGIMAAIIAGYEARDSFMHTNERNSFLAPVEDREDQAMLEQAVQKGLTYFKERRDVEALLAVPRYCGHIRDEVLSVLGEIDDARAVNALIASFREGEIVRFDRYVSSVAATALVKRQDERALEPLLDCLGQENENLCLLTIHVLAVFGGPRVVEPLMERACGTHQAISSAASEALAEVKDADVVEAILRRLPRTDSQQRVRLIRILCKRGDPRAFKPLVNALIDAETQSEANNALEKILATMNPDHFLELDVERDIDILRAGIKKGSHRVQRFFVQWLAKNSHPGRIEALVVALDVDHTFEGDVRKTAEDTLLMIGEPAVPFLISASVHERSYPARRLLSKVGGAAAARSLLGLALNAETRTEAIYALIGLGEKAVDPLVAAWEQGNAANRALAVKVLAQIETVGARLDRPELRQLKFSLNFQSRFNAVTEVNGHVCQPGYIADGVYHDNRGAERQLISAIANLARLLETHAGELNETELQEVLRLNHTHIDYRGCFGDSYPKEIDSSHLRQLARQELIRRGVTA